MGAVEILQTIYDLVLMIDAQLKLVKANKAQCERLSERIKIITQALKGLNKINDSAQFRAGLIQLQVAINECLNFIKTFTADKKWYKQILKAGNYKEQFEELNTDLEKAITDLNIGLNAQQIINREQDKADQQADFEDIKQQQDQIIELNKEALEEIQHIQARQSEQHDILMKQLQSMRFQFTQLNPKQTKVKPPIDPKSVIPFYDIIFSSKIDKGSFGAVFEGRWCEQPVAIKTIEGELTTADEAQFIREVDIMSRLHNANITQFYGACLEAGRACLVMEYMPKGSLYKVLGKEVLTPEQQHSMALAIARGLHYLHSQGILHQDLKSANVLVDDTWRAKLTDFGLSKTHHASIMSTHERSNATKWMAPECFKRGDNFTAQSDIYAYGVILWELVTGQRPFATINDENTRELTERINDNRRGEVISSQMPTVYTNIIKACWKIEPDKRPPLSDIIHQLEQYVPRPASPSAEDRYQEGINYETKKDLVSAFSHYKRSSEKGYFKAHTNLGMFYLQGLGGANVNKQLAYQHFFKGAQQGHVRAMTNLAIMLEKGDGILADTNQALHWYNEAAAQGDKSARERYDKLNAKLNEQRAETLKAPR